jgi:hypothetical protein
MMVNDLSAAYVRSILDYEPGAGEFRWKARTPNMFKHGKHSAAHTCAKWNSTYVGKVAGCANGGGYLQININDRPYQAHRLAWLWMTGEWPKEQIDHRDGDPSNNRWLNLREATQFQNMANSRKRSTNSSGVKGVHWNCVARKWHAGITKDGCHRFLGSFDEDKLDEAAAAYANAAYELHGEFARLA